MYSNATFRIKINNGINNDIPFKSGVRQGCSLSGGLYVLCLEPLLHYIRCNPCIPGVIPPGGEFPSIIQSIFHVNPANVMIKVSAYADDVSTFVFNNEHERATKAVFQLYNKASGGRTNEDKTLIFLVLQLVRPAIISVQSQPKLVLCSGHTHGYDSPTSINRIN